MADRDELESLCSSLPGELALRVISLLPSPLLFQCRSLCKAAHTCALRTLARRPFFVYQKPSSECFLLPLDTLSTPLPCSLKLGISSFTLFSSSSNLICLQRRYQSMLDVCVCSIFCKWKVTLPPIVHPNYAPRLLRRVFTEDCNVDSLHVISFEALSDECSNSSHGHGNVGCPNVHDPHGSVDDGSTHAAHGSHVHSHVHGSQLPCNVCLGSHNFRIVAVNNTYARVFDSRQEAWSDPVYQFADVLTPSQFMVAGFPIRLHFNNKNFKLSVCFPHVEAVRGSTATYGLTLEGVCKNDRGPLFHPRMNHDISKQHRHSYAREILYNNAYDYQSRLYFLLIEKERITCFNRDRPRQQYNTAFHSVQPEDVEKYIFPEKGTDLACHEIFPASTPCMLTLYIAYVDTINWTMQLRKENATALLKLSDMWEIPYRGTQYHMGEFLLIKGVAPC